MQSLPCRQRRAALEILPRRSSAHSSQPCLRHFAPRLSRTLLAPASRHAASTESVVVCAQNFEDAPRANVRTRREHREGRGFCARNFSELFKLLELPELVELLELVEPPELSEPAALSFFNF